MRQGFAVCLIAAVLCLAPAVATACSCMAPPPPTKAMEGSTAVFSGKVTKIETDADNRRLTVTFKVIRVWKGQIGATVVVTTVSSSAACGYPFSTEGEATYLVYANGEKGSLSTGLCTRTAPLDKAGEDLKELGEGKPPAE